MADTVQSRQKRDLFDIIDKLRSQGTSKYVDLPEIIVCGDQSSGKSSVLEAISGMSFPTKDNLCTRFATELILRRTPDITSCTISIIPDAERSEFEKAELKRFDQTIDSHDLNLGKSVEEAKEAMGLSETKRFSTDILRVELCGPDQPHLTMVDLPGLFSAGDKDQTNEDAKTVKNMVVRHMNRERSIILAVISAKNDFANQQVTTLTRKIDRDGSRTMGLITKPDTLHRGSESEAFYINLAKNRNVKFQLGWHILRNRDYPERSSSAEERNATEQAFFEMHPYSTLEASQLGVASLKPRLSEVLLGQILFQLPGLQDDVEAGIKDCESRLRSMGSARSSLQEQKRYLFGVSNGFTRLMEHAVQGTYGDVFFGDAMKEEGEARRLRAVVQNRLLEFADVMREEGRTRKVIDTEEDVESWTAISRKKYVEEVNQLMRRSRGKELPGTFNPLIIGDLFAKQCTKWKDFTFRCLEDILDATEELINDILEEVAADQTQPAIRSKINDGMEAIKVDLRAKTTQVLANHVSGHPITYNHYLTDQVRKIQAERREKNLEAMMERIYGENWKTIGSTLSKYGPNPTVVFDNLRHLAEVDMESYASSLAVDYAEAYFKVASKRFIDDLADLSVERCLMAKAPGLFSRHIIDEMDDEEINEIAKESVEAAELRARYTSKLGVLQAGLADLRKLDRHRARKYRKDVNIETEFQNDDVTANSDSDSDSERSSERDNYSETQEDSDAPPESPGPVEEARFGEQVAVAPTEDESDLSKPRLTKKEKLRLRRGLQPNGFYEEVDEPASCSR